MDKHEITENFLRNHGLVSGSKDEINEAIYWLEKTPYIIAKYSQPHFARLEKEVTWGLILSMLDRINGYLAGALVTFKSSEYSSAEILTRATIEASVNVIYILQGNPLERMLNYLSSYFATEHSQNKQWRKLILVLNDAEKQLHEHGVLKKEKALDIQETLLIENFKQIGISYKSNATWPSIFDRFKAIGRELDYRTMYAALSSQVHNDAEDLLNKLIIHSLGNAEYVKLLADETREFSQMHLFAGTAYYLEANLKFSEVFNFSDAVKELEEGQKMMWQLGNTIAFSNL